MNKKRCPWCGKIINRFDNQKKVNKLKTPQNLIFARCIHCKNFYGQSLSTPRNLFCSLVIIFLILLGVLLQNIFIAFSSLIFILLIIISPIVRMDKSEHYIRFSPYYYNIQILKYYSKIKKNKIYFLNCKFDQMEAFSTESPIYIKSINRKTNYACVCFLYDCDHNIELLNKTHIEVFDNKMKLVAEIKFD